MTDESPRFSAKAEANAQANLNVTPKRSHALLAILIVASVLFAVIASVFLYNDKVVPGYVFLAIAAAIIAGVFLGYFRSQKDQDQAGSIPVTLNNGPGGTSLTVDIRSLPALEKAKELLAIIHTAFIRKPLPTAAALLDEHMQPIAGSADSAARAADATNAQATEILVAVAAAGIGQDRTQLDRQDADSPHNTQQPQVFNSHSSGGPSDNAVPF